MRFLLVYAILAVAVCLGALGVGCSASPAPVYTQGTGTSNPDGGTSQPTSGDSSVPQLGSGDGGVSGITDAAPGIPGVLTAIVRDFRLYDASDPTTVPDFENPPLNIGNDGGPDPGYTGSWYDDQIVASTLGTDNTPVYLHPGQTTVTTHGADSFQKWYHDVSGTNINVSYPIELHPADAGVYAYDSEVDGVPYNLPGTTGDGFFPIDDGSPYQTAFGDQGLPHNYSFTMEIHTVFTYQGASSSSFAATTTSSSSSTRRSSSTSAGFTIRSRRRSRSTASA